jgi:hypothetical protein
VAPGFLAWGESRTVGRSVADLGAGKDLSMRRMERWRSKRVSLNT